MKVTNLQRIKEMERYCDSHDVYLHSGGRVRFDQIISGGVTLNEKANELINELLKDIKQWELRDIYGDEVLQDWARLKESLGYLYRVEAVKNEIEKEERVQEEKIRFQKEKDRIKEEKVRLQKKNKLHEKKVNLYNNKVMIGLKNDPLSAEEYFRNMHYKGFINFQSLALEWAKQKVKGEKYYRHLSEEQFSAVANLSLNALLRARAGSGKTTVIKSKVDFMIRHARVLPEEIMVLAFNKEAVNKVKRELQQDFNHLTFENSRTFHSLAYQIVLPTEDLLFDIDSGSNAKQSKFVEDLLKYELNPVVKKDIYEFFRREMEEVNNLGSLLSSKDYYSMRRNTTQDTLKGDPVKSMGEKWIADFLFEHGIRYVYERSWYRDATGEKGNYYPDFSLAVAGEKPDVVIEHWGIDEFSDDRTVPKHWSRTWQQYKNDMEEKRKYWRDWNERNSDREVVFLETSIRDMSRGREYFEDLLKECVYQ